MRELLSRIRDWFHRDRLERELAEELRFHQRHLDAEREARGDDDLEAFDRGIIVSRRTLGNLTAVREAARDRWSLPWLDHLQRDVRYAWRSLRRSPGFSITVMLTLGLGIGANVAMFDVVDRLMFRPFPQLRDPATVNRVYLQTASRGRVLTQNVIPYRRYTDIRQWTTSFSDYAGFTEWRLAVGPSDVAQERQVDGVSASFFNFFDTRPALGRFFAADEDAIPRGANVVVLGYGFWKTELGGRDVIGRTLQVGPLSTMIIGVAPEGFVGVSEGEAPAVFMPITTLAYGVNQGDAQSFPTRYNWDWMSIMVRRKSGVSAADATSDLTNAFIRSRETQRLATPTVASTLIARPRAIAGALKPAAGPDAGLESKTLLWVTGVAAIVLLIACANVANLMFARVLRRRREIAVRLALGVSRGRLTAQFLTESLMLALLGLIVGVVIGGAISVGTQRLLTHDGVSGWRLTDWRTLLVAACCAIGAGVLTSVAPALLAVRGALAPALRSGAREGTYQHSRIRSALLVVQGALSVMLLVGAGLFVRSLDNVRSMHLGWDPAPVLIVTPNYRGLQLDTGAMTAFRQRLLQTAQSIPGVVAAARVNALPFATSTFPLFVSGIDSVQRLGRFNYQATTPRYFATVGTRIVHGRAFDASDHGEASRVAVVSESMGNALWPGQDPIGKCLRVGADTMPCTIVIGVAEDAVQYSITDHERFLYYMPDEQPGFFRPANRLLLRMSNANALDQIEAVRRALQQIMPAPAYVNVAALEDLVDNQRRAWKLGATMFVAFGALALIVAAVGLYGVISYTVAQRMHELGVRIALGARTHDILALVLTQGIVFAASGVTIGFIVSAGASRWIQPLLFQETAKDPLVFGLVAVVIGTIALIASAAPAIRATHADPNTALRVD